MKTKIFLFFLIFMLLIPAFSGCKRGPLKSQKGNIIVDKPIEYEVVKLKEEDNFYIGTIHIEGKARVFEATLLWKLVDDKAITVNEGFFMADAGAPEFGNFSEDLEIASQAALKDGVLTIYYTSMKDGSIEEFVGIPLKFELESLKK